ncbi:MULTISPECIES: zonular occludens toxin family protein [unclassified Pseudoalteromonas]|uniref:zonular occludens toxin family protein n=1 Tax=unclassified Pseudoalteromonas TaxID=194690 RepID=UPI0006943925|nr:MULTISPECIES: zonular occludens toxin domain-containing protein [unclassified Pseudoalteromonas]
MATKIFHGPPGSYKSSTVCWFELLEALKAGRLVVTNLQGIKTIEEISRELNIVFPKTTRLVRISSNNDLGRELIRNFYHWLPIGAFIFIDEIQDIYPNDKTFKATDYDYKEEGYFDDKLPPEVVSLYHQEQRVIKSNVNVDDYTDDLGLSLFDDRDYIKYPPTLREAFMRHRHFNWDVVLATPDIKEVAGFIRSVTEVAYAHSSKDAVPIPYFKRRPRVLEHLPSSNGVTVKKGDITSFRKIPLDVFKIYKSTATGQSTKSGAGNSPITGTLLLGAAFFIALVVFIIYVVFFRESSISSSSTSNEVQSVQISNGQKQTTAKAHTQDIKKNNSLISGDVNSKNVFENASALVMPFNADSIYLTALNKVYKAKSYEVINGKVNTIKEIDFSYLFVLKIADDEFYVSDNDLSKMGYRFQYYSDSLVKITDNNGFRLIPFAPIKYESLVSSNEEQSNDLDLKL